MQVGSGKKYSETYDELYRAIVDGDVMEKTVEMIFGEERAATKPPLFFICG